MTTKLNIKEINMVAHNYILKTKTDKAVFIASVLFQKRVTLMNWKVRELVKKKVVELDDLVRMAEKALIANRNMRTES
jgi:hypothetical protein